MPTDSQYRVAAMRRTHDGTYLTEIDDCTEAGATDTLVVRVEKEAGAWVKAWVWVSDSEAEKIADG